YGFKVVQEMISGLSDYMDRKGFTSTADLVGRAVPNVTDWQFLNLNYTTKAQIDQDMCIKCGRCYAACEDTSHQAIAMQPGRVFEVKDDECVACNLCIDVCPVENCITMRELPVGETDPRTGRKVAGFANWTTHPNNPMARAAE
ncbi:MAG TPA: 4Fe-4S dicluster domain-containing protein, partial [Paracoccus sp. (in: a-proteobacteria)]|nr:4Fe-4S dicluster domain-containing protein [Paracoccus sp. (in: a-proteobacteria)]